MITPLMKPWRGQKGHREDKRFTVISNEQRIGVPLNHKKGVEASNASSEDVIVHLDGDDWFYDESSYLRWRQSIKKMIAG